MTSFMIKCECGRGKYNPKMTDKCAYCEFGLQEEPMIVCDRCPTSVPMDEVTFVGDRVEPHFALCPECYEVEQVEHMSDYDRMFDAAFGL